MTGQHNIRLSSPDISGVILGDVVLAVHANVSGVAS